MNAAVAQLRLEADREVTATAVSVCFDDVKAVLHGKRIVAMKARRTFSKVIPCAAIAPIEIDCGENACSL